MENGIYALRICIWIATIYLVSGPLRKLRVSHGEDVYLWTSLGVLAVGFTAGFLLAVLVRKIWKR